MNTAGDETDGTGNFKINEAFRGSLEQFIAAFGVPQVKGRD
jgi:hypothetical protein